MAAAVSVEVDMIEDKRKVSVVVAPQMDGKKNEVLTLLPKRIRSAVSMRADETDNWGHEDLDEREDFTLVFKDPSIKNELLERLNTFRRQRELCDVVLFVKEREIFAHKVVLAAVSPSLFDMFVEEKDETEGSKGVIVNGNNNLAEKKSLSYFEFAHTDFDCFEALVNFAYTSYLEITSKKVAELYKTAFALQMIPVIKACANFLGDNLTVSNCIGIRRQANFQNDSILMKQVDRFIRDNFDSIAETSTEFKLLPVIQTRVIVPSEDAKAQKAMMDCGGIAEMALQYFQNLPHDKAELSIEMLVCKTHILFIEEDHLADCSEMDERSSVGSCDIIQDYKKSGKDRKDVAKAMTTTEPVGTGLHNHRVNGAVPVRLNASRVPNMRLSNESLESAGTDETDPAETIEFRLIGTYQTADQYFAALVVLYRRLAVLSIQLTDDEELTRKKEAAPIDAQKAQLLSRLISCTGIQQIPLANMQAPRCSVGASFVNGKIIVCGGYDRGECLKSVEEYDLNTGEWKTMHNMKTERGRFDSAVSNGKVYAIAGSNGTVDLKTAEMFDPRANTWEAIPSLQKGRCHNGCATLDNFIYTIAGSSDQVVLTDCERFDVDTSVWETIAPLEQARYQAGVCAYKGMILAIGGCDRWNCISSVEAYDPKTNSWRHLAPLRQARRGCAVAVVRDQVYVIGGHDGTNSLSSVEILDHPTAAWRQGPVLTSPRANTQAVVTAGHVIYAIGGFNGMQFLDTIELLESEQVGWRNWQQSDTSVIPEEEEIGDDVEDEAE